MPLVFTLAFRNLFHDRLRFVATVIGIVFSIVLVTVQMGLYLGFGRMVTTMIDHASADLWIMPTGTKCFEDPSLLDTAQAQPRALDAGRAEAHPGGDRLCRLADRRAARRRRCSWSARICGPAVFSPGTGGGPRESLSTPNAVAVDRAYFEPARHFGRGRARRNPPADRAGGGGHRRHPLVHDDAVCVHGCRPRARPHRRAAPARPPTSWCVSVRAPTSSRCRRDLRPASPMSRC